MSNILGRVPGKSHLITAGVGWQIGGLAFSNRAGTLNLVTTPTSDYAIGSPSSTRNTLQLLPEGQYLLDVTAAIDAQVAPLTTALYTVPAGLNLEVKALFLRCTAAVAITLEASGSAGEGAAASNVYGDQILTGLVAADRVYRFPSGGSKQILTAGQVFGVRISVPSIGTSQSLEAQLYGRLFE